MTEPRKTIEWFEYVELAQALDAGRLSSPFVGCSFLVLGGTAREKILYSQVIKALGGELSHRRNWYTKPATTPVRLHYVLTLDKMGHQDESSYALAMAWSTAVGIDFDVFMGMLERVKVVA